MSLAGNIASGAGASALLSIRAEVSDAKTKINSLWKESKASAEEATAAVAKNQAAVDEAAAAYAEAEAEMAAAATASAEAQAVAQATLSTGIVSGTLAEQEAAVAAAELAEAEEVATAAALQLAEAEAALAASEAEAASAGSMMTTGFLVAATAAVALFAVLWSGASEYHQISTSIMADTGAQGAALDELHTQFMNAYSGSVDELKDLEGIFNLLVGRFDEGGSEASKFASELGNVAVAVNENGKAMTSGLIDAMDKWNLSAKDQQGLLDQLVVAHQESGSTIASLSQALAAGAVDWINYGYSEQQALAMITAINKTGGDATSMTAGLNKALVGIMKIQDQQAKDAKTDAAAMQKAGQQELEQKQKILQATEGLADAQRSLSDTEQAYNRLVSGGGIARAVVDGENKIKNAKLDVEDATNKLIDAEKKLAEIESGPTAGDIAEARAKQAKAIQAVADATVAQAKAENELADARSHGVTGTDLADKMNAVTQANTDYSQAQADVTKSGEELNDTLNYQTSHLNDIKDAQTDVAKAQQNLADKNQNVIDTQADLEDQLGPNLDGSKMQRDAFIKIAQAQQSVQQAQYQLITANQKHIDQQAAVQTALDETGGSFTKTREAMDKYNLKNDDGSLSMEKLVGWLGTTKDTNEALGVSVEVFGTKKGPQMLKSFQDIQGVLPDVTGKLNDSAGAAKAVGDKAADGTSKATLLWRNLRSDMEPIFGWLNDRLDALSWDNFVGGLKAIASGFGSFIGGMARGFVDGLRSIVNGGIDALNWLITGFDKIAGLIPGVSDHLIPWIPHWGDNSAEAQAGGRSASGDGIRLAAGGVAQAKPGGVQATLAEAGRDEAVVPLGSDGMPVGWAEHMGGGGDSYEEHYHFDMRGAIIASDSQFERMVTDAVANARRKGNG